MDKKFTSGGDFLLTHDDFTWITEGEFSRNKTIANSTITTFSYSPVVWNQRLLDRYNTAYGLTSSRFNQTKYIDESERNGERVTF